MLQQEDISGHALIIHLNNKWMFIRIDDACILPSALDYGVVPSCLLDWHSFNSSTLFLNESDFPFLATRLKQPERNHWIRLLHSLTEAVHGRTRLHDVRTEKSTVWTTAAVEIWNLRYNGHFVTCRDQNFRIYTSRKQQNLRSLSTVTKLVLTFYIQVHSSVQSTEHI